MKKIADLIQKEDSKQNQLSASNDSNVENSSAIREALRYNNSSGSLPDGDCPLCHNKGYIMLVEERYAYLSPCICLNARKSREYLRKSGLEHVASKCTLDMFNPLEEWHKQLKAIAFDFIKNPVGKSFYISGQVGSGKTHLCSGIVLSLIESGNESRYFIWPDLTSFLKRHIYDGDEYTSLLNMLKTVPVLYLDDFFKSDTGKEPTPKDISIAFEIINHRYNNRDNLVTIISSELSTNHLLDIDEAVGSRIFQMTKGYNINIKDGLNKNFRLKDDEKENN